MPESSVVSIGSIVNCRNRQWVVLPSENEDITRLRPLSGNEDEIAGIYRQLGLEAIKPAKFPLPDATSIQDHNAALLLMDAARLLLRSGAGPFRSLGRISLRPRPYQLVPLLMALRLETVRLLIADDVGIGKTIEAGLIARELLDRSEVKRLAVLCPPHLFDQWQQELRDKFHIVLERQLIALGEDPDKARKFTRFVGLIQDKPPATEEEWVEFMAAWEDACGYRPNFD